MFNLVKTFERAFTPVEGGYLFYPHRWSGGYLVTEEEYEALLADWRKFAGLKGILLIAGFAILAIAILIVLLQSMGYGEPYGSYVSGGIAGLLILYIGWKGSAANRLVKGREPVTDPRTSADAERDFAKQAGRSMAVWMTIASLCFFGLGLLWTLSNPWIGIPTSALFAFVSFVNVRIAIRAFRPNDS